MMFSTTELGQEAELLVSNKLISDGYMIISRNWRTKYCEIDIIATKSDVIYFVEVKYRKNSEWGDGFDAITQKKLKQMRFAAEIWLSANDWPGDALLQAAAVAGDPPQIIEMSEVY